MCSGHTLLFEDSIDLAELLERNGFSPSSDTQQLQPRKHAVPDEHYDEMGQILEPWRVSFSVQLIVHAFLLSSFSLLFSGLQILTSPYITRAESLPNPEMKARGFITSTFKAGTDFLPQYKVTNYTVAFLQPKRPVLFVGNPTMFGIYDSPVLVYEVSVPVTFPCDYSIRGDYMRESIQFSKFLAHSHRIPLLCCSCIQGGSGFVD